MLIVIGKTYRTAGGLTVVIESLQPYAPFAYEGRVIEEGVPGIAMNLDSWTVTGASLGRGPAYDLISVVEGEGAVGYTV